ncbi:MAG: DUF2961 domain-containing protein, partial [Candidatus Hydrogenedentes bacterium]|nr:DUF2961 domain-containing protein [Candidatus Hydrogenedentota bacterium]
KVDGPDLDTALRQTVLHIYCDGSPWGQVQSPVGDFFGAGPGVNPYTSVPFTVAADGTMTCRYVMPYKESVRVVLENRSDHEVKIASSALVADYTWDDAASMHFRARWRMDHGLTNSDTEDAGVQDVPFLFARGAGVYVGTAIMLLNPNCVPISWGNWWGEGDEKIFVDDDTTPSIFGTGSEDYFNYAWSMHDIFYYPYCGQSRNDGPANRGNVVNFRWHVIDPIPFQRGIAFSMELFGHERTPGISYGRISYYYARPGAIDDSMPLTNEDLRVPRLPDTWEPAARFGAENFVFTACEDLAVSQENTAIETGGLWQGGRVLVWTPKAAGDRFTFNVALREDGDYSLALDCMYRPGAGAFRADIGGAPLKFDGKDTTDLAVPANVQSRMLVGHAKGMKAGTHPLTLTAIEGGRAIGLDFVGIQKRAVAK